MSGLQEVARSAGIKPEVAEELFEEIFIRVANGEEVRIKGFGTFLAKKYPGRTLKSPAVNDGEPIKFKDSMMLKFRQSQLAKQRLNTKGGAKKAKAKEAEAEDTADEAEEKPTKAAKGKNGASASAKADKGKGKSKPKRPPEPEADDSDDDGDDADE